jgi:hypothetical protein
MCPHSSDEVWFAEGMLKLLVIKEQEELILAGEDFIVSPLVRIANVDEGLKSQRPVRLVVEPGDHADDRRGRMGVQLVPGGDRDPLTDTGDLMTRCLDQKDSPQIGGVK